MQARLRAIEGLDLALFVDAEDQSLVRRIEIEPDNILHLRSEVAVARNLESLDQMRLQPVRAPDPLYAAVGNVHRRRHTAHAPMGRFRRALVQRHVHHLLDLPRRQRLDARRAGCVFKQPLHPLGHIATTPAADREYALACRGCNRTRRQPIRGQQDDPCPPDRLLRRIPVTDQPLQSFAISYAERNPRDLSHSRRFAGLRYFVNRLSGTEH